MSDAVTLRALVVEAIAHTSHAILSAADQPGPTRRPADRTTRFPKAIHSDGSRAELEPK
jgi:hypothetical protein